MRRLQSVLNAVERLIFDLRRSDLVSRNTPEITSRPFGPRSRAVISHTGFAFRPSLSPPPKKAHPKFRFGPSGLAFEGRKCLRPQFFTLSMSAALDSYHAQCVMRSCVRTPLQQRHVQ